MTQPYPASGTLRSGNWIKRTPSKYTPSQVAQYLSAIDYEPAYTEEAISSGAFPTNLETLERLMRLHMLTFPIENTEMHYTPEHVLNVAPEALFHRLVVEGKGSYCFGNNGLMLEMLRGLGFRAYGVGGRVNLAPANAPPSYLSTVHLTILVQPTQDNQTYLCDVGFGSSGITHPLLLSTHPDNIIYGLSETERHRLTRHPRADSSLASSQDLATTTGDQWHLEVWHKKSDPSQETWRIQFSFTEEEFWLADILFASWGVSTRPNPTGWFWIDVLCIKMFTIDEGNLHLERSKRPTYRIILTGNEVRKSLGTHSEVLRKLETELDRIRALREFFGVHLEDEDQIHIVGRAAAYK